MSDWTYGDHVLGKTDDDLVTHFIRASSAHAIRALELELDTSNQAPVFAAIHAGAAIELLAKAALTRRNPLLLTIGQKHEMKHAESILGRTNAHDARTTDAAVAKTACGAFHGAALTNIDTLLKHRNAAAHMGLMARADLPDALIAMRAAAEQAITHLGIERADYWGGYAEAVTVALTKHTNEVEHAARTLIAAHFRSFASLNLTPDEVRLRERHGSYFNRSDTEEPHPCPACKNEARLGWSFDVDVEYEGPGEYTTTRFVVSDGLWCPVCDLTLDAEQCEAVGIDVDFYDSDHWVIDDDTR